MGKVGQSLIDGFPGCADELGDLLLGEVVGHPHCTALLCAEPLGELQQLLGDPAGHIGENQVGEVVVCPAQSACEHP